jgi:hypothetical protein
MRAASLIALASVFGVYRYSGRNLNGVSAGYSVVFPIAVCVIIYMLLRSMFVTLARRGVVWRGTFYPLAELRKHAGPLR